MVRPVIAWTVVALLTMGAWRAEACPLELFRITRSTNANVVAYEAAAGEGAGGDPLQPVWLMLAEDGRREELNGLERALAYGVEVREVRGQEGPVVILKAAPRRPLRLRRVSGCTVAFTAIAGRDAVLRHIHVDASGGLFPQVRSVELVGTDPASGEPLREVVEPTHDALMHDS